MPGSVPPKPDGLSERAGAEWDRLAEPLAKSGLLNDRFQMVFATYCECVAEYWDHKRTVARGYTTETTNGNIIQHPAVGMMGKCLDRMLKLERELGLTPAAATGLQPGSEGNVDPLEELEERRAAGNAARPDAKKPAAKKKARKSTATRKTSKRTSKKSSRGK